MCVKKSYQSLQVQPKHSHPLSMEVLCSMAHFMLHFKSSVQHTEMYRDLQGLDMSARTK